MTLPAARSAPVASPDTPALCLPLVSTTINPHSWRRWRPSAGGFVQRAFFAHRAVARRHEKALFILSRSPAWPGAAGPVGREPRSPSTHPPPDTARMTWSQAGRWGRAPRAIKRCGADRARPAAGARGRGRPAAGRAPLVCPQGGWGGDAWPGSPRDSRMARMICGLSTVATRRSRPAQRGQASTSTPNARCINCAQAQWRGRARGVCYWRPSRPQGARRPGPSGPRCSRGTSRSTFRRLPRWRTGLG